MRYETQYNKQAFNKMMPIDINQSILRGELRKQEPMSRHTSWKTGGVADYYYRAADLEDLSEFMRSLPADMPLTWIGYGSNLLVRDGGIRGAVVSVKGVLDDLDDVSETEIRVGAGNACVKAARFAAKQALSGVEFLAGIPGTIGGALAMNAGAYGGEIWDYVVQVETLNRAGELQTYNKKAFDVAYRSVSIPDDHWFVATTLKLEKSSKTKIDQSIREMLAQRAEAQPLGQNSCGSVFRNPPNDYAARLIEACGLKGKQIGGACVSEKHANFIINTGNATSLDIEQLIRLIKAEVDEKHAVTLIPEVRMIGEYDVDDEVVNK